ncbi:hypothetical protein Sps_05170 [Shewanella psychrophila]|uniref:LysM domain-containing protein n=1 Tax=Shewanella psychrophila TaxID=225848 RepID=A0A1S6HXK5_9GAMM|nr:LysM peptidoglycan-binding domain-containing protein [Shewanella psychrophila]AQS40239.1 hypothetical protein Sps_05170 [Shewanella psychrophila]
MPVGKIVNIDALMLHDADSIESDTSWLSDKDWESLAPTAGSVSQVKQSLEAGESVLLTQSPQSPLFAFSQGERSVNVCVSYSFPSNAVAAITQRFNTAGSSIAFERAPYESLHPSPPLDYTPDTSKVKEKVIPISCQYNVEVACSPPCLETLNYGYFMLAKTKNEPSLALSTVKPLGKHSLLTTLGKFEEPKQLLHMLATGKNSQLSVKPVKMVPLGSQQVYESFVPVQLTVQVGERLGYPTQGAFYHFKQGQLVHEYAIVEDAKGYFNITHSTANALSDEVNIPALRGSIFLHWKINGQLAPPQHIYYSKQKLTTEEFHSIDVAWLNAHAFTVDLKAILAVNQEATLERAEEQTSQQDKQRAKPQNHAVLPSHDGPGRENWPDIAKQYGLTPNELLALNPTFQQDPMKLKAGDILIIAKSEATQDKPKVDTQPPQSPQAVSRADNIHYQSSTPQLAPGVIGITKQSVLKDVAVLNLVELVNRNTKSFPDEPLRDKLKENNEHIMFLTLKEALDVLRDWGWKDTKGLWKEGTDSELGQVLINYGVNGKDVVTASMLISQLGSVGIKATSYLNKSGTEMIKLSGYAGIRKVLNAPSFSAVNPKIVQVGIGKYGLANSIKSGAVLTFYVAAAYRIVDYILTDEQRLSEFIGSMATDVVKIGIASAITWGVGSVIVTSFVVVNFGIVIVAGLATAVLLNYLDNKYGITNQVIEYLEKSQQEVVDKARDIEDGFWDLGSMILDGMLEAGKRVIENEVRSYIRSTIQDIKPRMY